MLLVLLAVVTRLLPLSISSYPYNNDSLTECTIAEDILAMGNVDFPDDSHYADSHSVITPAYNVLLAFASSMVDTTPIELAQVVIAAFSVVTVLGGYLTAMVFTNCRKASIATALVLSLFGTFVFLTGSAWKESLGVALLILVVFLHINRNDSRMFVLEIIVLGLLPIVHHLVTGIAYLSVWLLTILSMLYALSNSGINRGHVRDTVALSALSLATYAYYHITSLDRLSLILGDSTSLIQLALILLGLTLAMIVLLRRKRHFRHSLAPLLAVIVFSLVLFDYVNPLFPHEGGSPPYVLILAISMSVLIGIGWFGIETLVRENTMCRLVPVALLAPVITIMIFSIISGSKLSSHWLIYRTYDFADIPLALGVAAAIGCIKLRPKKRVLLTALLVVTLVVSFPFAYFTGTLTGIRHDTQAYEVAALQWMYDCEGNTALLLTDERLGYVGSALYGFEKRPNLPEKLISDEKLPSCWYFMFEEEWTTVGVNSYPYGHPLINSTKMSVLLSASITYYVGGPPSNNIIVFSSSGIGYSQIT